MVLHARTLACAVSVAALLSVAGPAAAAHADSSGSCDAKLLAYFKADDASQSAQANLTAAQQAFNGAEDSQKVLQDADSAIREAIVALPWTKGSLPAQQNLGKAVRAYKSLYIKAVYGGSGASGAPSVTAVNLGDAAQGMADAAQSLIEDAKLGSDQATTFTMGRVTEGVSDVKAAYPLFLTIPDRKADLAQATQQADSVQSGVSVARGGLETCLQNASAE